MPNGQGGASASSSPSPSPLEQVLREMGEAGAWRALSDSMDGALARIEGRPAPKRQKRAYESSLDEA